jgi:hypothetical protein
MDCVRSSGEVVRKNTENIEIRAKNLMDIETPEITAPQIEPVAHTIAIKLKTKMNAIKIREPFIDWIHWFVILLMRTMGNEDDSIRRSTNGLIK